jgi:mannosyl-3-phosphoglycerate phosphatase
MLALPLVLFTDPLDVFLPLGGRSEQGAQEALAELERRHVPLVFASRGTRMEVEFVRRRLGNRHPFITENGGGLFVPEGYFRHRIPEATSVRHYHCVSFARPYAEACAALEEAAAEAGAEVVGFHQMSAREVAENAGLPPRFAELARLREYDEPFFFAGEEAAASRRLEEAAKTRGWRVTRGERFWHISGGADPNWPCLPQRDARLFFQGLAAHSTKCWRSASQSRAAQRRAARKAGTQQFWSCSGRPDGALDRRQKQIGEPGGSPICSL